MIEYFVLMIEYFLEQGFKEQRARTSYCAVIASEAWQSVLLERLPRFACNDVFISIRCKFAPELFQI